MDVDVGMWGFTCVHCMCECVLEEEGDDDEENIFPIRVFVKDSPTVTQSISSVSQTEDFCL